MKDCTQEDESKVDMDSLITTCTRLYMSFQRKEQLPRKFTEEDWKDFRRFEAELERCMLGLREAGEEFLEAWRTSPLDVRTSEQVINTRELKRCLKMLVIFRDRITGVGEI